MRAAAATAAFGTAICINFVGRHNPWGVTVKTIENAVVTQQNQMAIRRPVEMSKFGNKDTEEIGMFLRRYEMAEHAQKWTDEDLLAMLPFSLEERSGAEY
ncbi:hypothetical protein BV898_19052 [Hypsibius exemplaris]|uniref:Uncharacterized protein n=1 Tax=Hypsibius exemplaris TaxID=2072580 RepID=A0A9X6NKZ5_HYPEX|nr:hypothetical protein BV898_19052 [Hypsibius exemplaris]